MSISFNVNTTAHNIATGGARESRRPEVTSKVDSAKLDASTTLTAEQALQTAAYCNQAVDHVDKARSCADVDFDKLFPHRNDDKKVDEATKPNPKDNEEAAEVRSEYKKAYREAKRERARAVRLVEKLGPGEHKLSNGDQVNIKVDKETGQKTVTTTKPDGTVKTVTFNDSDPQSVAVTTKHPDGSKESLTKNGTEVTKTKTDQDGNSIKTRFGLDEKGNPVKETSGPSDDDYKKVVANKDGSTKSRIKLFHEEGVDVYAEVDKPGKAQGVDQEDESDDVDDIEDNQSQVPPAYPHCQVGKLDLDKLFPHRNDDKKVDEATKPRPNDNADASKIRSDYKKLRAKAKEELAFAKKLYSKLGPGRHKLSNGDVVRIKEDKKTGQKTVQISKKNGTVKTISYNEKDPNSVKVTTKKPDGSSSTLTQNGTSVSQSKTDAAGKTTSKEYFLSKEGQPVLRERGPEKDDEKTTTVNEDGSTDVRNLIYREENGTGVYEDKHQDPKKS